MKSAKTLCIGCLLWIGCLEALQGEAQGVSEPIFVSLGSHCEVAAVLNHLKLRGASFPFDWLLTFNYQGFLLLLEEDFAFFMDPSFLEQQPQGDVLNTRYRVFMRHDWPDKDFEKHLAGIQEKYRRRIARFNSLVRMPATVYFIRSAFDLSLDPSNSAITPECNAIDVTHAEALRDLLYMKFPGLNFYLIIVNYVEEHTSDIFGLDRIIELKIRKNHKVEDYSTLLQQLP